MAPKSLFRGLHFCFYPQPALSKINGVKSRAARQFGAAIEPAPSVRTTHLVVARESVPSLSFERFLRSAPLSTSCSIVDSTWPSRCIEEGRLLALQSFLVVPKPASESSSQVNTVSELTSVAPSIDSNSSGATDRGAGVVSSSTAGISSTRTPNADTQTSNGDDNGDDNGDTNAHTKGGAKRARPPGAQTPASKRTEAGPTPARRENASRLSPPSSPVRSSSRSPSRSPSPSLDASFEEEPNQVLIDAFKSLVASRKASGDEFSARAYARMLSALEKSHLAIMGFDDAMKLRGTTEKMARLIDDIRNGRVPQTLQINMQEHTKTLALFETVYGVGPRTARALYEKGFRTLEEIAPHVDNNGRYSIAHHADLVQRISREEVNQHYEQVHRVVAGIDPEVQAYCMGSYRRGEPDCGDIDIVLTREGASIAKLRGVLKRVLSAMFADGLATHTFSTGSTRWLGATQTVGKIRRMDILLVPWQELGAAMIYYTGNSNFNRAMRLSAIRRSMRLNEKGLYRVSGDAKEFVEGHDERRIFELLGWTWLEPHERIM